MCKTCGGRDAYRRDILVHLRGLTRNETGREPGREAGEGRPPLCDCGTLTEKPLLVGACGPLFNTTRDVCGKVTVAPSTRGLKRPLELLRSP